MRGSKACVISISQPAYEGVKKRALRDTLLPWRLGPKGPLDDFYAEHGYMPPGFGPERKKTDPRVQSRSRSGSRFRLRSRTASMSGTSLNWRGFSTSLRTEQLFMHRAANYKNLFRADKGLIWPKDIDGKWIEPLDPKFDGGMGGRDYYDENNGYTYTWDVAQDFGGLVALMGGTARSEANLDQLFREPLDRSKYEFQAKFPDSTSMVGQYSMGNEPSFAIPYIYNRLGASVESAKAGAHAASSHSSPTRSRTHSRR